MATTNPNIAQRALLIIGAVLVLGGGVIALLSQSAAARADRVDQYVAAISGYAGNSAAGLYVWMWIGIVGAILGVLILLGVLFLRAATRPQD